MIHTKLQVTAHSQTLAHSDFIPAKATQMCGSVVFVNFAVRDAVVTGMRAWRQEYEELWLRHRGMHWESVIEFNELVGLGFIRLYSAFFFYH